MSDGVFLYCHAHRDQVGSMKSLVGAGSSTAIDWDGDFTAGDDWFDHISALIQKSNRVFLFWCNHAAASPNVRREIEYCQSIGIPMVPVLFDETPLPGEFAEVKAIDLRGAIRHETRRSLWPKLGR